MMPDTANPSARGVRPRLLLLAAALLLAPAPAVAGRVTFPVDPSVINAKRDLGAKGDGITDDTDALQRGLDASCGIGGNGSSDNRTKVLFLPNGVYRVTQTLVVKSALGPWLYGESRDGSIIRLADGVSGCNSVLRTHPRESGKTSADWFMRNIRNLTVDVGNNPSTDGIRWYATNSGIIHNVHVTGHGKIGINAGFLDQSGPNLIEDTLIDGYETGILTQWIWGETISRVTIRNCRKVGLVVNANAVAAEDLVVENTPRAVFCDYPNDWTWWGGVLAIDGGRFSISNSAGPAIRNRTVLYGRNLRTRGYRLALQSKMPAGDAVGPDIREYSSEPARKLFSDSPSGAMRLTVKREPHVPWETNSAKWVCANDYGAVAGDNRDDTASIQKAIDEAARLGKTTVYLRGIGGADPNWYDVRGVIRVHGSVRAILGLGFGRIVGSKEGRFVITDDSAPVVKFQNIDSFGGAPVVLENRSRRRTMVVESCGVDIVGTGTGEIFATDCPSHVQLLHSGQRMWARQLNPEGTDDVGLVRNEGGDLWDLGLKCEGAGVRVRTSSGGRTEVLGAFIYDPGNLSKDDPRPMFDIDNASLCIMGIREINFGGSTYPIKVRERRGNVTRLLTNQREPGWIGWPLYSGWTPRR